MSKQPGDEQDGSAEKVARLPPSLTTRVQFPEALTSACLLWHAHTKALRK